VGSYGDVKGMIPKKEKVLDRARELYVQHCYRNGCPDLANVNPEDSELAESGFVAVARSELMTSMETKNEQWLKESESVETSRFQFDTKEGMATTTFITGSRGIGKSDIAMRIVDKLKNEGVICIVFDPSTDWIQRSSVSQYSTTKPFCDLRIPETSTLFDISQLTPIEQQRIVENFSKKLFEYQLSNSAKRFYLVFEESQIYFPLNSLRSLKTQNSMRVLTVGRNVNISTCAISQFPSLIDKELIKNCGQIWIGYTSELNALKYWKGILGKRTEKLKGLQNGEFIYYCRNNISKIQIEPYEAMIQKQRISISEIQPTQPIKPKEQISAIPFLRLGMVICFTVLLLGAIR